MFDDSSVSEYRQELERRVGQFAKSLKQMRDRTLVETGGPCFLVVEDRQSSHSKCKILLSSAKPSEALVAAAFDHAGIRSITIDDEIVRYNLPNEKWIEGDAQLRFIQFSFEEKWFCLDMPLQTLYRDEAEKIMQSRKGFFYLKDRPEFTLYGEDVNGYDPFRKIYIYGDEDSAAEDMAFILFQVWRYPVDWCFFQKAAPFSREKAMYVEWENETPMM